jgi:hypothetical protein
VVRATAITPEPVADRAGHGIHRVAEDARLVRKEWADCADLSQDARAQISPIWRGATDRAGQPTGEQNAGSARGLRAVSAGPDAPGYGPRAPPEAARGRACPRIAVRR